MPADQSTPTPLATERFRLRKSRSGTSGAATRDSIVRKTPKRIAAAPRRPSVSPDNQPFPLPLTIA